MKEALNLVDASFNKIMHPHPSQQAIRRSWRSELRGESLSSFPFLFFYSMCFSLDQFSVAQTPEQSMCWLAFEQAGRKAAWLSTVWRVTGSALRPAGSQCHYNWSSEKSTGRSRREFTGAQLTQGLLRRKQSLHASVQWASSPANRVQTLCADNRLQTCTCATCTHTEHACTETHRHKYTHTYTQLHCVHKPTHIDHSRHMSVWILPIYSTFYS